MLDPAFPKEISYYAVPPIRPLICSPEAQKQGVKHNLWTRYLDMRTKPELQSSEGLLEWQEWEQNGEIYGNVYTLYEILNRNGGSGTCSS
jgi:hypothetical protein